jgi:hypothetical protein
VHLKWVNCVICDLYSNKSVILNSWKGRQENGDYHSENQAVQKLLMSCACSTEGGDFAGGHL